MLCCEHQRHFLRKKLLPWKLMNCVGSSGIMAQLCQQMDFSRSSSFWAGIGRYLSSFSHAPLGWPSAALQMPISLQWGQCLRTGTRIKGVWWCDQWSLSWLARWCWKRWGGIMTSLSKFLNCGGFSLTSRGSQSLMTDNHIPLLSAPLSVWKNGDVFVQQLENKCQHLLSKRYGFLKKKCYHTYKKGRSNGEFSSSSFCLLL